MSAEPRTFVDTTVDAYAYDSFSETSRAAALPIVRDLRLSGRGCVSHVLQELARPLEAEPAREVIEALSHWSVHAPTPADVDAAIRIHGRYRISFRDAMIVRSAAALGCETLLSEDLNAGQRYDGVLVVDPFA